MILVIAVLVFSSAGKAIVPVDEQGSVSDTTSQYFVNGSLPISCHVRFGSDFYEGDITPRVSQIVDNPGDCCKLCQQRPDCRAWIWRKDYHHCWLKYTAALPSANVNCIGGILHQVIPRFCNKQPNIKLNGPNLRVLVGTTIGDCCEDCHREANCLGWVFEDGYLPKCYLKSRIKESLECAECTSGTKEKLRSDCNVRVAVTWQGNDIIGSPFLNLTWEECCMKCKENKNCVVWSYRRSSNHCYLKHGISQQEMPCGDCIGGIKQSTKEPLKLLYQQAGTALALYLCLSNLSGAVLSCDFIICGLPRHVLYALFLDIAYLTAFGGNIDELGNQVFVTLRRGKNWPPITCDIRIKYEETIDHIKTAVSEKLHISKKLIQLFWHKQELTSDYDNKTLLEMNLHTGFSLRGYDLTETPDYWPPVKATAQGLVEITTNA